jgi:hypothetical protein
MNAEATGRDLRVPPFARAKPSQFRQAAIDFGELKTFTERSIQSSNNPLCTTSFAVLLLMLQRSDDDDVESSLARNICSAVRREVV